MSAYDRLCLLTPSHTFLNLEIRTSLLWAATFSFCVLGERSAKPRPTWPNLTTRMRKREFMDNENWTTCQRSWHAMCAPSCSTWMPHATCKRRSTKVRSAYKHVWTPRKKKLVELCNLVARKSYKMRSRLLQNRIHGKKTKLKIENLIMDFGHEKMLQNADWKIWMVVQVCATPKNAPKKKTQELCLQVRVWVGVCLSLKTLNTAPAASHN